MTTVTNSSVISHAATANFRAWGLEMSNALTSTTKFPKSADTGQINWATANKPAVNVSAGYEIRYLNDSMHASAPIYVKLEFGTNASSSAYPAMWITIGTGSNGSGTITGIVLAREEIYAGNYALDSTVVVKASYYCGVDGCIWFAFKTKNRNAGLAPAFAMYIERTRDSAGTATSEGFVYHRGPYLWGNAAASTFVYNFSTAYTYDSNIGPYGMYGGGYYTFLPVNLGISGTIVGGTPGDYQITRHYICMPLVKALGSVVSSPTSDLMAEGTTFTCTPLGVTGKTHICLENAFSYYDYFCPIWE